MNIGCPECGTIFRIDPAKVPTGGVQARCSICSGVITVPAGETSVAAPSRREAQAAPRTPPRPFVPTLPPGPSMPAGIADARSAGPIPDEPPVVPATPAEPASPANTPAHTPVFSSPSGATPSTPAPGLTMASASTAQAESSTPAGQRRPINPFLARDPNLRAKRLARALISDMVAYYPAKHTEGLRDGTLKQLFRDEIKKSYEEYVAQVGAELAEGTSHFQESLNEVLGAGKKIF